MPNIRVWKSTGYHTAFPERNRLFIQDDVENLYRRHTAPLPTKGYFTSSFWLHAESAKSIDMTQYFYLNVWIPLLVKNFAKKWMNHTQNNKRFCIFILCCYSNQINLPKNVIILIKYHLKKI